MSKKLFLVLFFFASVSMLTKAQCVIYSCDETGAFGAGFNNDNAPTSYQECEDYAIKLCHENGGTDCAFLYKSTKSGWWGFINGHKSDGRIFFVGVDGHSSQSEAEREVRRQYREDDGYDAENVKVYTWYAYSNLK